MGKAASSLLEGQKWKGERQGLLWPWSSPTGLVIALSPVTCIYTTQTRDSEKPLGCPPQLPCREQRGHVHIANDISIWLLVERFVSDP